MSFLDTVQGVIDLARHVDEYYDSQLPKYHRDYPLIRAGEVGPPQPEAEIKLQELMNSFSEDIIYRLMTLMYLGRGDYGIKDLTDMSESLQKTFHQPDQAIAQMTSEGPLGEYLADGLAELTTHGLDVEQLPLPQIQAN